MGFGGWKEKGQRTNVISEPTTDAGQVISDDIHPEGFHCFEGISDVAKGFGHLLLFDRPVRVCEELLLQGEIEGL